MMLSIDHSVIGNCWSRKEGRTAFESFWLGEVGFVG